MLRASPLLRPLLLLSVLCSSVAIAGNEDLDELRASDSNDWQIVKNDAYHHIKTWSKREDGKRIRSFKIDMMMDASIETVARISFDFDSYTRWYFKTKMAKMLKQVSPTEVYYYQVFSAPPGLPDRDVVVHCTIEPYNARRGVFRLHFAAAPDFMPPQPGLVRMLGLNLTTTYTPQPDGKLRLESEGFIDPGGNAPVWATNYVQRNAPYSVMLGLQRVANDPDFNKSTKPIMFKYME